MYMAIAASIQSRIVEGSLNPGDLLPSENALMTQFSASRDTVRKSLKELEVEGYIRSQPGKGYFVIQPNHDRFYFDFLENGDPTTSFKLKGTQFIKASPEICRIYGDHTLENIVEIVKVIYSREKPVACDIKYLPYIRGIPLVESEIGYALFQEIAAAKTAPFAFNTKIEVSAELPGEEMQKTLNCQSDTPLLVIHRYFYDLKHEVIGYGKQYRLPDKLQFTGYSGYVGIQK